MTASVPLPDRPPFALRARMLTPLADGGSRYEPDGAIAVDAAGRIDAVGRGRAFGGPALAAATRGRSTSGRSSSCPAWSTCTRTCRSSRTPGLGAGLDLLTWLDRYIFPLERRVRRRRGRRAPRARGVPRLRGRRDDDRPRLRRGLRGRDGWRVPGRRGARDPGDPRQGHDGSPHLRRTIDPSTILERQPARIRGAHRPLARPRRRPARVRRHAAVRRLVHGRAAARVGGARRATGAWWQTHVSEDLGEIAEVARLFPDARDYVDVYDRAGGLGARTVLAHAIHLSERELARLVETGTRVAHCPASNLFLASGIMPLARYREAGLRVGLGSDVAGGPDLSIFTVMRVGAYAQNAPARRPGVDERAVLGAARLAAARDARRRPGARARRQIGSLEPGKEADLIAVDPRLAAPIPGIDPTTRPRS